jgi:hypothetical protein
MRYHTLPGYGNYICRALSRPVPALLLPNYHTYPYIYIYIYIHTYIAVIFRLREIKLSKFLCFWEGGFENGKNPGGDGGFKRAAS